MEDKVKQICEKFEDSKKRLWIAEGQRVWVDGALQGANSELDFRNDRLGQAHGVIRDLEKTLERSNAMKKEAREDYEARLLELRTTLKACKDLIAKE